MKCFTLSLAILAVSGTTLGFGYYDSFNNGSPNGGFTAESAVLGGIKAQPIATPAGLFMNPGALGLITGQALSVDGGLERWTETVYDANFRIHRGGQVLGVATAAAAAHLGPVVVALGAAKVADYDYFGTHNTIDPYTAQLTSVEIARVSGTRWEYVAGLSGMVYRGLYAGFSGGVRAVSADYDYTFSDRTFQGADSTSQWEVSANEFCWRAGLASISDLVSAGVVYSSGSDYHYSSVAFGGSVISPHINNTRTGFEAEVVRPFDTNDFIGKLFIDTPVTSRFDLRTSVVFVEGFQATRTSLGFGLGGGYRSGENLEVSVGCLWKGRTRTNAFPNEQADGVDDNSISLVLGSVFRL